MRRDDRLVCRHDGKDRDGSRNVCRVSRRTVSPTGVDERGGRTVVSDRYESLIGIPRKSLKPAAVWDILLPTGDTVALMRGACTGSWNAATGPSRYLGFPLLDLQRRLFTALYARAHRRYASVNGRTA